MGKGAIAWDDGRNSEDGPCPGLKDRGGDGFLEELILMVKTRSASGS